MLKLQIHLSMLFAPFFAEKEDAAIVNVDVWLGFHTVSDCSHLFGDRKQLYTHLQ